MQKSYDIAELIALRHELHQYPEVSGQEKQTAKRILNWFDTCKPTDILSGIGGYGLAAIYDSGAAGPNILFRCELDALPIFEIGKPDWRSKTDGVGHLCGHDGHMTIMCGLARYFDQNPPAKGRVILLFQPAEEDGAGARAILADPKFEALKPDYAFALHNLPGRPLHEVGLKSGPMCFASEGMAVNLIGKTSHASHPEDGVSPANALAELITKLPNIPADMGLKSESALATMVHVSAGGDAFGITPGNGKIMATFRSIDDLLQKDLIKKAERMALSVASANNLGVDISFGEKFAACANDDDATNIVRIAAQNRGRKIRELEQPFRWSEDFGLFGSVAKSCLFVLGAGTNQPQLHNPDYDFPDELIESGIELFVAVSDQLSSGSSQP